MVFLFYAYDCFRFAQFLKNLLMNQIGDVIWHPGQKLNLFAVLKTHLNQLCPNGKISAHSEVQSVPCNEKQSIAKFPLSYGENYPYQ